ncbi:MAG: hypothetical protein HYT08_01435 [Candidatus Levybacteria bacterium]|nr:hypothetical protein [Candidatus Levybacteria bacterium]
MKSVNLKNKIFLFDVNHTLINTATGHLYAMKSMEQELIDNGIEKHKANSIIKHVHYITSLMIAGFLITNEKDWDGVPGGKKAYKEILSKISLHQKLINDKWGFIKKWSREVFLKIAADSVGVEIDNRIIKSVVDAHWHAITKKAKTFISAKILFKELKKHNIPIYLLTSSDGRLLFENGVFSYDPIYSEEFKKRRMEELRKEGLYFNDIIVGDPHDKPSRDYFKKGISTINKVLGRYVGSEDLVVVGNSFEDDLVVPISELGFGMGILVDETIKGAHIEGKIIRIDDLREIISLL